MDDPLKSALNGKDTTALAQAFAALPVDEDARAGVLADLLSWQPPSAAHAARALQTLPNPLLHELIQQLETRFLQQTEADEWLQGAIACAENPQIPRECRTRLANAALISSGTPAEKLITLTSLVTNKNLADAVFYLHTRTSRMAEAETALASNPFSERINLLINSLAIRAAESVDGFNRLVENRPTLASWIMTRRLQGKKDPRVLTVDSRLLNQIFDTPRLYDWEDSAFIDALSHTMARVLSTIGSDSAHALFARFDAFHREHQRLYTVRLCEMLHASHVSPALLSECVRHCDDKEASLTRLLLTQGSSGLLPLKIECLQKIPLPVLVTLCTPLLTTPILTSAPAAASSSSSSSVARSLASHFLEILCNRLTGEKAPDVHFEALAQSLHTLPHEWRHALVDAGFQRICTTALSKSQWLKALTAAQVTPELWLAHCETLLSALKPAERGELLRSFAANELCALHTFLERTASARRPDFALHMKDFTPEQQQAILLSHPDTRAETLERLCEPLDDTVFLDVLMQVCASAETLPAWLPALEVLALLFSHRLNNEVRNPNAPIHEWRTRPQAGLLARRVLELKPCLDVIGCVRGLMPLYFHPVSVFEVLEALPDTEENAAALALCWLSACRHAPKDLQTFWANLLHSVGTKSVPLQEQLGRILKISARMLNPEGALDDEACKTLLTSGLTAQGVFDPLLRQLANEEYAGSNPRSAAQFIAEIKNPALLADYTAPSVAALLQASIGEGLEKNWTTLQAFAATRDMHYQLVLLNTLMQKAALTNSLPLDARVVDFLTAFDNHELLVAQLGEHALTWLIAHSPRDRLRQSLHGWLTKLHEARRLNAALAVNLLRQLPDDAFLSEQVFSALRDNPILPAVFVELGQEEQLTLQTASITRLQLTRKPEALRAFVGSVLTYSTAAHIHPATIEYIAQMVSRCRLTAIRSDDITLAHLYLRFLSQCLHVAPREVHNRYRTQKMTLFPAQAGMHAQTGTAAIPGMAPRLRGDDKFSTIQDEPRHNIATTAMPVTPPRENHAAVAIEKHLVEFFLALTRQDTQWVERLAEDEHLAQMLLLLLEPLSPEARISHPIVRLLQDCPTTSPHMSLMESTIWQNILQYTLENPACMLQSERFLAGFQQLSRLNRTNLAGALLQRPAIADTPCSVRKILAEALTPQEVYRIFAEHNAPEAIAEALLSCPQSFSELNNLQFSELFNTLQTSAQLARVLDNTAFSMRPDVVNRLFDNLHARGLPVGSWLNTLKPGAEALEALCHYTTRETDKYALQHAIDANPCLRQFMHQALKEAPGNVWVEGSLFADRLNHALNAPWEGVVVHPGFLGKYSGAQLENLVLYQWLTLTAIYRLGMLLEPMSNSSDNLEDYTACLRWARSLPQLIHARNRGASSQPSLHAIIENSVATHCSDARLFAADTNSRWLKQNLPRAAERHAQFLSAHALTPMPWALALIHTLPTLPAWKEAHTLHAWLLGECLSHPLWDDISLESLIPVVREIPLESIIRFARVAHKMAGFLNDAETLFQALPENTEEWCRLFASRPSADLQRITAALALLALPVLEAFARCGASVETLLPRDSLQVFITDWLEADARLLAPRVQAWRARSTHLLLQGLIARNQPSDKKRLAVIAANPACLESLSPYALAQCLGSYLDAAEQDRSTREHCFTLLKHLLRTPENAQALFSTFTSGARTRLLRLCVMHMNACESMLQALIDLGFKNAILPLVTNALKNTPDTDLDAWMPLRRLQLYACPPPPFDAWLNASPKELLQLRHQFVTDVSLFELFQEGCMQTPTDENLPVITASARAIAWIKDDAATRKLSYLNVMDTYSDASPIHEPDIWYRWLRFAQLFADNPQEKLCDGLVRWVMTADISHLGAMSELSRLLDEVLAVNGLSRALTHLQGNPNFTREKQSWLYEQILRKTEADEHILELITHSCSVEWLYEQFAPQNPNRETLFAKALLQPRLMHALLETDDTQRAFLKALSNSRFSPQTLSERLTECNEPRLLSLLALHLLQREDYLQLLPPMQLFSGFFAASSPVMNPLTPLAQRVLPHTLTLASLKTLSPEAAIALFTCPHLFHGLTEEMVTALLERMGDHLKNAIGYWLQQCVIQPDSQNILPILLDRYATIVLENLEGFGFSTVRQRVLRESLLAPEKLTQNAVNTLVHVCDEGALLLALNVYAHRPGNALQYFITRALEKLSVNPLQPHTLCQLMRLHGDKAFAQVRVSLENVFNANLAHFAMLGNMEYLLEGGRAPLERLINPMPSLSPSGAETSSSAPSGFNLLRRFLPFGKTHSQPEDNNTKQHPIVIERQNAGETLQVIDYFLIHAPDMPNATAPLLAHYFNELQAYPDRERATHALHQTARLLQEDRLSPNTGESLREELLKHPALLDDAVIDCMLSSQIEITLHGLGEHGHYQLLERVCERALTFEKYQNNHDQPRLEQARAEARFERELSEMQGFLVGLRRFFKRWWHDLFAPPRMYVTPFDRLIPLPEPVPTHPANPVESTPSLAEEIEAFEFAGTHAREQFQRTTFESRINHTSVNREALLESEIVQTNRIRLAGILFRNGDAPAAVRLLIEPPLGELHQKAADSIRLQPLPVLRAPTAPPKSPTVSRGLFATLAAFWPASGRSVAATSSSSSSALQVHGL